jgi:ABC-type oligopeptide transport system substrate-binding subunit
LSWIADYPDPQDFLDILFHSNSQGNQTNYSNPQVDALLEKARVETNPDTRMQLYRQAEQIIIQDTPVVPLYHNVTYTLVKPKVKGLVLTPMGILSLKSVQIGQ